MKAKIILNHALTQERYGLHFDKGEAYTENEYLIKKLKAKGVKVEIVQEETERALEDMTIKELTEIATEKGIEVPNKSKKADIIKLLNADNEETVEETAIENENEETTGENTESEEETTTEETSNEEETTTNTENEKEVSEE